MPKPPPSRRDEHEQPPIDQLIAACHGGHPPVARLETEAPVTEAFLLGCLAQRFPGQLLEWDSANMRLTSPEKLNEYVDPPYRSAYATP